MDLDNNRLISFGFDSNVDAKMVDFGFEADRFLAAYYQQDLPIYTSGASKIHPSARVTQVKDSFRNRLS